MKKVMIFVIFLFFCLILVGYSWNKPTVVQTNQYYQQDYDYFCFDETKTWSQIVVCLTAEGKAERTQNKITNDLLDNQ